MTRGLLLALLMLAACASDPAPETPAGTDVGTVEAAPSVPEADTLALAADARTLAERPTAPLRIEGACPFEGCTYGAWATSAETTLYGRAADTTSAASTVPTGTTLTATEGFVLMTRLGEAVALRAGEVYVAFEEARPVAAGDTLLVFEPEGEGSVRLWHAGTVGFSGTSAIEGPGVVDPVYRLVVEPEHQWWARVTTPDGRAGWLWMDRTPPVSGADAFGG